MSAKTYRIGEAADLLQLKTYVLRFWETEFAQLAPLRTEKGQRLYTEEHVELLRRIKHLLHERGMTIDGARRILVAEPQQAQPIQSSAPPKSTSPQESSLPPSAAASMASPSRAAFMGEPAAHITPKIIQEVRDELVALRKMLG